MGLEICSHPVPSAVRPQGSITAVVRLFWLTVLVGHLIAAALWWWLEPGGFPWRHPRFWSNRLLPGLVVLWASGALASLHRDRAGASCRSIISAPELPALREVVDSQYERYSNHMRPFRVIFTSLVLTATAAAQEHVSFPTQDGGVVQADLYGKGDRAVVLAHGGRFNLGPSDIPGFPGSASNTRSPRARRN